MSDKADMFGVTAAKDLISIWWHSIAVFHHASFVFESDPAGVFKGDNMVDGEKLGTTVLI